MPSPSSSQTTMFSPQPLSSPSPPTFTYTASHLIPAPEHFSKEPIADRLFIKAIVKSAAATSALQVILPTFIAYDAVQTQASISHEPVYVRLQCFIHSTGDCVHFERYSNTTARPLFHGEEYCFLVNGLVNVDSRLFQIDPYGSPSETSRKHDLVYLSILGQGACGTVFLAHDLARSTPDNIIFSAVKLQKIHGRVDSEVRYQRKLSDCEGTVTLYRSFKEDGYQGMVMERMYTDLGEWLSRDRGAVVGNMPAARMICNQLFDSVEYMHDRGFFHRCVFSLSLLTKYLY